MASVAGNVVSVVGEVVVGIGEAVAGVDEEVTVVGKAATVVGEAAIVVGWGSCSRPFVLRLGLPSLENVKRTILEELDPKESSLS